MQSWLPNSIAGWVGVALIIGTVAYHRSLGTLGLVAGFGIGMYLYFVMDNQVTSSTTTTTA